ncbi:MAG: S8 family serine peptidase [Opitutae bacterium]|nr:S8 family serine peptidase [Opitutae bacterium]
MNKPSSTQLNFDTRIEPRTDFFLLDSSTIPPIPTTIIKQARAIVIENNYGHPFTGSNSNNGMSNSSITFSGIKHCPCHPMDCISIPKKLISVRSFNFILIVLCSNPLKATDLRIDEAIPLNGTRHIPVFVRMADQLFAKAGEHETFCRDNAKRSRTVNRKAVLATLKSKSKKSRKEVNQLVQSLENSGSLQNPQWFWIVNGFSCTAQPDAIIQLSKNPSVSFIYLNRFNRPKSKQSIGMNETQAAAMQKLLELRTATHFAPAPPTKKSNAQKPKIPWNVQAINAEQAWRSGARGQGVTVAVIDSGIIPTTSLAKALWWNKAELLDGKDNDNNGFVDDAFGYNFTDENGFLLEQNRFTSHGSACAGIIAGRQAPKSRLQTGIAPEAELMLLKGSFDLRALEYLLLQGADLVSMSFMIVDRELGHIRGLYRNAFEHLSAAGVLALGGAGNYASGPRVKPRGQQIGIPKDIPCVVAVAGIKQDRSEVAFSSRGPCFWENVAFYSDHPLNKPLSKPDITAFPLGYPTWNHPPKGMAIKRGWKEISREDGGASIVIGPAGNSFSGPHGVGVAALMLSVNNEINPWQIKDLLEKTATDIGPKGRDHQYGAGLINAVEAVKQVIKQRDL